VRATICFHSPAASQLRRQGNKPLQNVAKGLYMFTCLPDSSHITPTTSWDTTTVSKMGLMIVVGLLKRWVLRQNPSAGSVQPTTNRVRDKVTQRVASSWRYPGPHLPLPGPLERYICPCCFSPIYSDPDSTQILTWHRSA
jgi:hypothetical protein